MEELGLSELQVTASLEIEGKVYEGVKSVPAKMVIGKAVSVNEHVRSGTKSLHKKCRMKMNCSKIIEAWIIRSYYIIENVAQLYRCTILFPTDQQSREN